ncbi:MAG: hypothetical protein QOJ81_225 [Chloroflexota bacterium]|nr:hypothetical protein [Chloroflexota bacterium]
MTLSDDDELLREIAEYPNSFAPLGPRDELIENDRYSLWIGAGGSKWNTVQRQRLAADQVETAVEEVRGLLRQRGRESTQWEVGSKATPNDLVDRLLALGLIRDKDPVAAALVLTQPPPAPPPGVVARRLETFDEYVTANEVQMKAFESTEDEIAEARSKFEERWRETVNVMHAAWIDGEMVSAGTSAITEHGLLLFGGATLPSARGRGGYRALLNARWDEAVRNGTPALFTQGGQMSRPVLEGVGFRKVGEIQLLLDEFGRRGP